MLKIETLNHCHALEEKGYLFKSEDSGSTEDEYLHLLHALIYALKPLSVLETGAYQGMGTAFICKGLLRNAAAQEYFPHRGRIISLEINPKAAAWAREQLRVNKLDGFGTVVEADSMEWLAATAERFDFAFFDSQLPLRVKELQICLDRGILGKGAFWAMHDTSRLRTLTAGSPDPLTPQLWSELDALVGVKFLEFPLSRGLLLGQVE